ncbi:hypothetical protein SODALDRAFT_333147 [Sodiomyces alkalinus F11]|uniref:PHD-type domain-containing protein n=1 Tax=Sodiomyces alkalinus (strain CBS 110278 / VKM F-3762 / F11) TaxID=1314773 RepID=A0A3N2PVN5_SODAK|nr:hypothetical protein SODALDRAFT_333147 [Sodiomyces alkalinus F11]ROT38548.1 hypothetical protein SODALDRAFT_333147 [Sodiomyces alkalinus F11]
MSGDQQASSFGDPNALPPTPKRTPTSAHLPSPVFKTPKNRQGPFNEPGGWTPLFAEEYSVFNTTPGNLQASHSPFAEFTTPKGPDFRAAAGVHKRQPSTGGRITAAHDTHLYSNPNLSQSPVNSSRVLPSSPGPVTGPHEFSGTEDNGSEQQGNNPSKTRRSVTKTKQGPEGGVRVHPEEKEAQGQTATPPPSSHKRGRNSRPKLEVGNMQNDNGYGQPDFAAETPQQPNVAGYVSTSDFFGYPMSAPAAAPSSFWDPGADMSGMDIDFSFGVDAFQMPTLGHRPTGSFDANQMFQDMETLPQEPQQQTSQMPRQQPPQQQQPKKKPRAVRKPRPLAPKTSLSQTESKPTSTAGPSMSSSAVHPGPIDNRFNLMSPGTGVDPGLLFSRPQSSSMDISLPTTQVDRGAQFSMEAVAQALSKAPVRNDLRRSSSTRERPATRVPDRSLASSPMKSSSRPGLQRSLSENRGKRSLARNQPPSLAPPAQPTPAVASSSSSSRGVNSRPPSTRPSGRTSPLKNQFQLSSLTSIPEAPPPRARTLVRFTIDADGRARAETTVVVDGETTGPGSEASSMQCSSRRSSREAASVRARSFDSGDEEESTDDEPIILPSRNTSFALPDPHKPTRAGYHTSSQRSVSDRSTSSYMAGGAGVDRGAGNDAESEAETVMNGMERGGSDDAANELRRLRENRQKRVSGPGSGISGKHQQQRERGQGRMGRSFGGMAGPVAASPTSFTDGSLPTPSTEARGRRIRCVCQRNGGNRDGDGFMVQCESCEMWLHGQCIRITSRRMLPSVYICAFCANTPNARGIQLRESGRDVAHGGGASPLAHKSFKSFR